MCGEGGRRLEMVKGVTLRAGAATMALLCAAATRLLRHHRLRQHLCGPSFPYVPNTLDIHHKHKHTTGSERPPSTIFAESNKLDMIQLLAG